MSQDMLIVELGVNATNPDLIHQMRLMNRSRDEDVTRKIVCLIRGYDADPRELPDIPEVAAFCGRLLSLGFSCFLEYSTTLPPYGGPGAVGLGHTEVWMFATGRAPGCRVAVTKELLDGAQAAMDAAFLAVEATFGPDGPAPVDIMDHARAFLAAHPEHIAGFETKGGDMPMFDEQAARAFGEWCEATGRASPEKAREFRELVDRAFRRVRS